MFSCCIGGSSPAEARPLLEPRPVGGPNKSLLKRFCIFTFNKIGSKSAKVLSLVLIGLGVAAFFTGIGAAAAIPLMIAGGSLFAISSGISVGKYRMRANGELNVVTYNMGANINDYQLLCKYHDGNANHEKYKASQQRTALFFRGLVQSGEADVILLQEVYDNTVLLNDLQQQGFVVYRNNAFTRTGVRKPKDDCAILLNPNRFEVQQVVRATIDELDAPVVVGKDKRTGYTFMFATAHVPGMDLINPVTTAAGAGFGDGYIQKLTPFMNGISDRNSVAIQIFGADMNSNPEKWQDRFAPLLESGFSIHRTGVPTEVNPDQPQYVERELDFQFSRVNSPSLTERLLGRRAPRLETETRALMDFQASHDGIPGNASDHRPVKTKFTIHTA
jgi:hypothetical protein